MIDDGLSQKCVEKSSKTSWECALFDYKYLPWALKEAVYMTWFCHAILIYQNVVLTRRNTCSLNSEVYFIQNPEEMKAPPSNTSPVFYTMDPDTIKSWVH